MALEAPPQGILPLLQVVPFSLRVVPPQADRKKNRWEMAVSTDDGVGKTLPVAEGALPVTKENAGRCTPRR